MMKEWETIEFTFIMYRDNSTLILSAIDDIQQLLDDQIVKTQSMRASSYIKPFEAEVREWERKLLYSQETIDEWLKVQATWMYLEPIFSSEDIMQQMPTEGKNFKIVDSSWKTIMKVIIYILIFFLKYLKLNIFELYYYHYYYYHYYCYYYYFHYY